MKNSKIISGLMIFAGILALPSAAHAASLLEIYQQALQSDPAIHEAEARRLAALESKPQARSAYLPQLSFTGDYSMTEQSGPTFFQPDLDTPRLPADVRGVRGVLVWGIGLRQRFFGGESLV